MMSTEPLKIRLETYGKVETKYWRVFVGDMEVSRYVRDFFISSEWGEPVKVTIGFINVSIDQPKAGEDGNRQNE